MKPQDISYFIAGLRHTIYTSGMTQEEFAKGVTSKVNLSNVLRETSGTSQKMREALAQRAGKSVLQLVHLGRQLSDPYIEVANPEKPQSLLQNAEDLSSTELMAEVTRYGHEMIERMQECQKNMLHTIRTLTEERDKLVALWSREQAILNGMHMSVLLINTQRIITYCNRAGAENYNVYPGDKAEVLHGCDNCSLTDCIVEQAFNTGNRTVQLVHLGDRIQECIALPMTSSIGIVTQVVLFIRDVTDTIRLLQETSNGSVHA